jgi:tubulin alpha
MFCNEHGVQADGSLPDRDDDSYLGFFDKSESGKHVPRGILVDLDPTVVEDVRIGQFKDLFNPDQIISGKDDASSNYARGRYTVGKSVLESSMDSLRRLAEGCDLGLQGFMVFHATGGGSGSGIGTLIFEALADEFAKQTKLDFNIVPSPNIATSVLEPYNSLLSHHACMDLANVTFNLDNEALYQLATNKLSLKTPSYGELNRLIAQLVSSLTASLRFQADLNVDLHEFQTNLVPFPRIHFPMCALSPVLSHTNEHHANTTVGEITNAAFSANQQMISADPQSGEFMSITLMYRGDVRPKTVNEAVNNIKKKGLAKLVDWCPTGFKVGINTKEAEILPDGDVARTRRSVLCIANNTAIVDVLKRMDTSFDMMYSKRAYVHWYVGEGMEEGEFGDAREDMAVLEQEYKDLLSSPAE